VEKAVNRMCVCVYSEFSSAANRGRQLNTAVKIYVAYVEYFLQLLRVRMTAQKFRKEDAFVVGTFANQISLLSPS